MELESEESDFQLITDDPEPNFCELAAAALDNAEIDPIKRIQAARDCVAAVTAITSGPRLVEADEDEIVLGSSLTFRMQDLAKTPFLPMLPHP